MNVRLVMFRENGDQRDFSLKVARTVIGRNDDCDIRIALSEISRRHVELVLTNDGVVANDLGSANGTYVNNQRVRRHGLRPGDHLIVGPVVFTVQIDGQPAAIRPVKTKLRRRVPAEQAAAAVLAAPGGAEFVDDDPIRELEALAGDTDQTVFTPLEDESAP